MWQVSRQKKDLKVLHILKILEAPYHRLYRHIFGMMDIDGTDSLDFIEFTLAYWNFCSCSKYALIRFLFYLYCEPMTVTLGFDQVDQIIFDLWGKDWDTDRNATSFHKLMYRELQKAEEKDAPIDLHEFSRIYKQYALEILLYQIFRLQSRMIHNVMGTSWWYRQQKRRGKILENPAREAFDIALEYRKHLDILFGTGNGNNMVLSKRRQFQNRSNPVDTAPKIWKEYRGPTGRYWTNGYESLWKEPQESKEYKYDLLRTNGHYWTIRPAWWVEHECREGGTYFVNEREEGKSQWDVPIEHSLYYIANKPREPGPVSWRKQKRTKREIRRDRPPPARPQGSPSPGRGSLSAAG